MRSSISWYKPSSTASSKADKAGKQQEFRGCPWRCSSHQQTQCTWGNSLGCQSSFISLLKQNWVSRPWPSSHTFHTQFLLKFLLPVHAGSYNCWEIWHSVQGQGLIHPFKAFLSILEKLELWQIMRMETNTCVFFLMSHLDQYLSHYFPDHLASLQPTLVLCSPSV